MRKRRCCIYNSAMRKSAEPFSGKDNAMPRAEKSGATISETLRENPAAPAVNEASSSDARMHQSQHRLKRNWCTERAPLLVRVGFMKASHCGKQDGNFLLAQMRIVIAQGLLGIHGQRCVSPALLCIKEWRGYPASPLENQTQVALSTAFSNTAGSRFRFWIMMVRQGHGRSLETYGLWNGSVIQSGVFVNMPAPEKTPELRRDLEPASMA